MPKISEKYGVTSHGWVDVELDVDQELYVDPMKFSKVKDDDFDSSEAELLMQKFMGTIDYMIDHPELRQDMLALIEPPHEMNETRFGLGKGNRPKGNATSAPMLETVFKQLRKIKGFDVIDHPEVLPMFTARFGADRHSDLATNIISRVLVPFTHRKCRKYGIPMSDGNRINMFNPVSLSWETFEAELPVHDGLAILFVPEECVVEEYEYTAEHYVWREVIEGRKFFLGQHGKNMTKVDIYKMDTEGITENKCKTYALEAAIKDPHRLLEYLEKRRTLA